MQQECNEYARKQKTVTIKVISSINNVKLSNIKVINNINKVINNINMVKLSRLFYTSTSLSGHQQYMSEKDGCMYA